MNMSKWSIARHLKAYCPMIISIARHVPLVPWTWFGSASKYIASRIQIAKPTALIISLPRSGSSWVGEILASADNALYLREPLTQSSKEPIERGTVFEVDPSNPPEVYEYFAEMAFMGLPLFGPNIVRHPAKWMSLYQRSNRHVVIKEVNPLALNWLLTRFTPRVIFLVRHPAAVALSFRKLGWTQVSYHEGNLHSQPASQDVLSRDDGTDFWERLGAFQGRVLKETMEVLRGYSDYRVVLYENLCVAPSKTFCDLFEFAGLRWNTKIEKLIEIKSKQNPVSKNGSPFTTTRDSQSMINAWKHQISAKNLHQLQEAYLSYNVHLYPPEDW